MPNRDNDFFSVLSQTWSNFTFMLFLSSNKRFSGFKSRWQMEWLKGENHLDKKTKKTKIQKTIDIMISGEFHAFAMFLLSSWSGWGWSYGFEYLIILILTLLIWIPVAEIKGRDDLTEEPPRFLSIQNSKSKSKIHHQRSHCHHWRRHQHQQYHRTHCF